jgi:hypothetical protein
LPNNGTRLVFSTSILINYPASFGDKLDTNAIEVANDKSRIYEFTKEELRIWLEVLKLRYGEERYNKVIEALELDKLPTFKKALNPISKPDEALIQVEPQEDKAKVKKLSETQQDKEPKTDKAGQSKKIDNPFTKSTLKQKPDEIKKAEPSYPYPKDNNKDEEREWIRRNLRPINDDIWWDIHESS